MKFYHYLQEKRRNPEKNIKVSNIDELKPYNKKNYFISFTKIPKLGINPKSEWDITPDGIYCYPLWLIWKKFVNEESLFASDKKYIQLLHSNKLFNIEKYNESMYKRDLTKLKIKYSQYDFNDIIKNWENDYNFVDEMFAYVYNISKHIAMMESNNRSSKWMSILWKDLGYNGLIDPGLGVLSWDIPYQAVIFNPKSYKHITTLINDRGFHKLIRKEEDRLIKRIKRFPWIKKSLDYNEKNDKSVTISTDNGKLVWNFGTFIDSIWKDGIWLYGFFINSVWEDGIWKSGTWKDSVWKNGTWENGEIFSKKFKEYAISRVNPKEFYKLEQESNSLEELEEKVS